MSAPKLAVGSEKDGAELEKVFTKPKQVGAEQEKVAVSSEKIDAELVKTAD